MTLIKHKNSGNLEPYFYFALEEYVMKKLLSDNRSFFFTWEIEVLLLEKIKFWKMK